MANQNGDYNDPPVPDAAAQKVAKTLAAGCLPGVQDVTVTGGKHIADECKAALDSMQHMVKPDDGSHVHPPAPAHVKGVKKPPRIS